MHDSNMRTIYESSRKMLSEHWFGTKKKPKDPFKKCTTNAQLYHLSRKIKAEQNRFLKRLVILCDNTGRVRNEGHEFQIKNMNELVKNFNKEFYESSDETQGEIETEETVNEDVGVKETEI